MQAPASAARWPRRLQELVGKLQLTDVPVSADNPVRGDIWLVLQNALAGYARRHCHRIGQLPDPDIADLVSEKSLDLLARIDSRQWNPVEEPERRIRALLSTVARNGVVDSLRANARLSALREPDTVAMKAVHSSQNRGHGRPPSDNLEACEFIECLRACVESLTPRARTLWLFRVLYEMPSRLIARHPDVQMNVGSVDVALQRCRNSINECMQTKGMRLRALPPGTFAELWESSAQERKAVTEEEGVG